MSSILLGNGINIQVEGNEYSSASIIQRAINNILSENFNGYDYPQEMLQWLYLLHKSFSDTLKGRLDNYAHLSFEKDSLSDLKRRYKRGHRYEVHKLNSIIR